MEETKVKEIDLDKILPLLNDSYRTLVSYNTIPDGYDLDKVNIGKRKWKDFKKTTISFLKECRNIKTWPTTPDFYEKKSIFPVKWSCESCLNNWDNGNDFSKFKVVGFAYGNKLLYKTISTNLDKDMTFKKKQKNKKIPSETLHAETNAISKIDIWEILQKPLWMYILARPCVPCSKSIANFHKKILLNWWKWIEHVFVLKDDLYPYGKTFNHQSQSDFQIAIWNLLDAWISVIIYELTIQDKTYKENYLAKSLYKLLLDTNKKAAWKIKIRFTKLDYEQLQLVEKTERKLKKALEKLRDDLMQ